MRTQYAVEGMHCQSCVKKVAQALRAVPGVHDADVSLDEARARVDSAQDVSLHTLNEQVAAAGDYHLLPLAGEGANGQGEPAAKPDKSDARRGAALDVEHDREQTKFFLDREGRESSLRYSQPDDQTIVLEHTYVPPTDRNRGIAESLTRSALTFAEEHNLRVVPECAYVRRFIEQHEEFQTLVEAPSQETSNQSIEPTAHAGHAHHDQPQSKLAVYWPLILTVLYLLGGTAIAASVADTWSAMFAMRVFMGLFFVAFSFFKLLDLSGFAQAYSSYDLIAERWLGYGYVYPFIELALGVAYLLGILPVVTNLATLIVMLIGTAGVVRAVVKGRDIQCGCLGTMFDLPMSTVTIVEDVAMAGMAAVMLVLLL